MRILHVLDTPRSAGTEAHLLSIARASMQIGLEPAVLCRRGSSLYSSVEKAGLPAIAYCGTGMLSLLLALKKAVVDLHPDLVHAHSYRTMHASALLASAGMTRAVGTHYVIVPEPTQGFGLKKSLARANRRWVNAKLSQVIAISDSVRDSLIGREEVAPNHITTVRPGIATPSLSQPDRLAQIRPELRIGSEEIMILTAAQLTTENGIPQLIAAARSVIDQQPAARFVIAGEGPLRVDLETECRRTGLGGRVIFTGARQDIADLMSSCDLVVAPSVAEPFGLSLLQAMALGKPVVAPSTGEPTEIVVNEETGRLFEPTDSAALAKTILSVISDRRLMHEMGPKGKECYAAQFTDGRMVIELQAVYKSAVRR